MKWVEARVLFEAALPEQAEELIAETFFTLGISGVLIEDPRQTPAEGWGPGSAPPPYHAVVGYLARDHRMAQQKEKLNRALERLADERIARCRIVYKSVDEEDWAESWKAYFEPLRISERVVVKPTWRSFEPEPDDLVLELDPGMAFGTGSHPTTAMCIQLIERYLPPGGAVLDVGTGSGILLVAAAKLGAGRLVGIDNDPVAAGIARRNLRLNGIAPDRGNVVVGDLTAPFRAGFDLIIANILTEVVLSLLDDLETVSTPGGILVCSGIIDTKQALVYGELQDHGFNILKVARREEWVALAGRRNKDP